MTSRKLFGQQSPTHSFPYQSRILSYFCLFNVCVFSYFCEHGGSNTPVSTCTAGQGSDQGHLRISADRVRGGQIGLPRVLRPHAHRTSMRDAPDIGRIVPPCPPGHRFSGRAHRRSGHQSPRAAATSSGGLLRLSPLSTVTQTSHAPRRDATRSSSSHALVDASYIDHLPRGVAECKAQRTPYESAARPAAR